MRDGSWTGYLGAAKLSGACQPDGKISAVSRDSVCWLLMTTRCRSFTPRSALASYGRHVTAKLMTFHFQIAHHVARWWDAMLMRCCFSAYGWQLFFGRSKVCNGKRADQTRKLSILGFSQLKLVHRLHRNWNRGKERWKLTRLVSWPVLIGLSLWMHSIFSIIESIIFPVACLPLQVWQQLIISW